MCACGAHVLACVRACAYACTCVRAQTTFTRNFEFLCICANEKNNSKIEQCMFINARINVYTNLAADISVLNLSLVV